MHDKAIAEFRRALEVDPENPMAVGLLGYACAEGGKIQEARQILRRLQEIARKRPISAFHFALIYMGLGDKDRAFELFAKACEEKFYIMATLKVDPIFDALRSDPRFQELLACVGLTA
jgi:Flp pilus assembly protein TadD